MLNDNIWKDIQNSSCHVKNSVSWLTMKQNFGTFHAKSKNMSIQDVTIDSQN